MKKLFTLLVSFGCLSSIFAQYRHDDKTSRPDRNESNGAYSRSSQDHETNGRNGYGKDYAYNDRRYNDAFSMSSRERDFKIQKIMREYDYRINAVSANRYIRPREKNRQIQNLLRQKYDDIKNVELCYKDSRNKYYDGRSNRW